MAEKVFTETTVFDKIAGERVVSIDAGSGTVAVQYLHGDGNWITAETYAADTSIVVDFGHNRSMRFVVSGDASFAL